MIGQSRISSLLPLLALQSSTFLLVSSTPFPTGAADLNSRNATERRSTPFVKRADTVQPGQPRNTVADQFIGGYQVVGNSGVAAQQLFLGDDHLVSSSFQSASLSLPIYRALRTRYRMYSSKSIGLYHRQGRAKPAHDQ
jgi:hypothetical protein